MKIQRTISPTAAPIDLIGILHGIAGLFIGNRYIERFEREIKSYFGVNHVFLVSSGKAGLTLILRALKRIHPERNQVLIPAYTCFSVPSAIIKAGLEVSLCDIDPATLDFDYKSLERSVNKHTLCIVSTHLFGIPSDVMRIKDLCEDKNIFVVEDAAQAMGGSFGCRYLGTIGDVGFFSLGRGKNITCGSGGIIVTNSDRIAHALEEEQTHAKDQNLMETLRNLLEVIISSILIHPLLYWFPSGLPFLKLGETVFHEDFPLKKLSGPQAGLLRGWQRNLESSNHKRRENASYFIDQALLPGDKSASVPYLRLPFFIRDQEIRDSIYSRLQKDGIGLSRMYPSSINEIENLKAQFSGTEFPSAKSVSESILTLPTHHLLGKKDKEKICSKLKETLGILPSGVNRLESSGCTQNRLKNKKLSLMQ